MAWSALYELLEALVAHLVSPELGAAYTGTQGDVWDAQKDAALAMTGALIGMAVTAGLPGQVLALRHNSENRSSDVSTGVSQGPPVADETAGLFEATSTSRIRYEPEHSEDRKA
jgi:hypothetical protein